jgi:hypothetical protein
MSSTHDRSMERKLTRTWIERWAPIGGITFVVFMVVGSMLIGDTPPPHAPEHEILDYLADGSAHMRNIVGAYLWVIGALAFLWFLTRLRSDLRIAEGGAGTLSNLAESALGWPSPQCGRFQQRPSPRCRMRSSCATRR